MRIFDVTNLNSNVENIAIRVGETGNYEDSSLKYWGSILDLPATYSQLDVKRYIVTKIHYLYGVKSLITQ